MVKSKPPSVPRRKSSAKGGTARPAGARSASAKPGAAKPRAAGSKPPKNRPAKGPAPEAKTKGHLFEIVKCSFPSGGSECSADLYRPLVKGRRAPFPLVIMAHGFGAERTFRLPAFAERFARRGMAVLLFDYRNIGTSPGEIRNWISPSRHKDDWKSAARFAKTLPGIDPERIALWGTSFSGGHITAVASVVKPAALCMLGPFSDGIRTALHLPPSHVLRALFHGLYDAVLSLFGRSHRIRIIGGAEEFALLNTPECEQGYQMIVDPDSDWDNSAPARIALTTAFYRPVRHARRISCPVFIIAGENDTLCPLPLTQRLAKSIPGSMLMLIPTGHFEPYVGEWFEKVVEAQMQFLSQVLRVE